MAIIHDEFQTPNSYTIGFSAYTTPTTATPLSILIKRNGLDFYLIEDVVQDTYAYYTFDNPSDSSHVYTVVYDTLDEASDPISFTVAEIKPTFTLPVTTCVELNQPAEFKIMDLHFGDQDYCKIVDPNDSIIEYNYYEFNINTNVWDFVETYITPTIDPLDYDTTTLGYSWTPTKLTMAKIVVTVTNCNTSVTKEAKFPICGAWKLRRLSCGKYRLYNYKSDTVTFSLYNDIGAASPSNIFPVAGFSYESLDTYIITDGIWKIEADGVTQYIFNFCSVEACVLSLQKQILLDDSLCDECKMDKALYQKAIRLIPIYETWKKLLDKDWVYDMQYLSTDASGELAQLYDAQELYAEIGKLCADCGGSATKRCKC